MLSAVVVPLPLPPEFPLVNDPIRLPLVSPEVLPLPEEDPPLLLPLPVAAEVSTLVNAEVSVLPEPVVVVPEELGFVLPPVVSPLPLLMPLLPPPSVDARLLPPSEAPMRVVGGVRLSCVTGAGLWSGRVLWSLGEAGAAPFVAGGLQMHTHWPDADVPPPPCGAR